MTAIRTLFFRAAVLGAMSLVSPSDATAHVGCCHDPVVTFTNGMRLPSTTALRSHNVYWQCDPYHLGYCDGRLYSPCRTSWRSIGTRPCGQFVPPYAGPQRPTGSVTARLPDGMEASSAETLGMLPTEEGLALPVAPVGQEAVTPPVGQAAPEGGIWIDALQTLGRKMLDEGGEG